MTEEIITISQEIKINYETKEGRELAIQHVLKDTNWIAFGDNFRTDKENHGCKTNKIKLIKNNENKPN